MQNNHQLILTERLAFLPCVLMNIFDVNKPLRWLFSASPCVERSLIPLGWIQVLCFAFCWWGDSCFHLENRLCLLLCEPIKPRSRVMGIHLSSFI